MHVSAVELDGFFEEVEAGVRLDHILHQWHQVLGHQVGPLAGRQDAHKPGRLVVRGGQKPVATGGGGGGETLSETCEYQ